MVVLAWKSGVVCEGLLDHYREFRYNITVSLHMFKGWVSGSVVIIRVAIESLTLNIHNVIS